MHSGICQKSQQHVTSRPTHTTTANGRPQELSKLFTTPPKHAESVFQARSVGSHHKLHLYYARGDDKRLGMGYYVPCDMASLAHGIELHTASLSAEYCHLLGAGRHGSLTRRIRSAMMSTSNSAVRAPPVVTQSTPMLLNNGQS